MILLLDASAGGHEVGFRRCSRSTSAGTNRMVAAIQGPLHLLTDHDRFVIQATKCKAIDTDTMTLAWYPLKQFSYLH